MGGVRLLENKAYVPMGFVVSDNALNYTPEVLNLPFDQLNRLFREMTGQEAPLYTAFEAESVEAIGSAKLNSHTTTTFSSTCEKGDEENCVEVTFRMPKDGYLCIYSKSTKCKDLVVFLNDARQYTYSDGYGYNRSFGSLSEGDTVRIRYICKTDGTPCSATFGAATFDTELFDTVRKNLMKNRMITTLVSDTRIEGAVSMQEAGLVYTSIPYDNGWRLHIDGEPVGITPVGDAMIAFHLEPGMHSVELEFETPGFKLGLTVSIFCGVAFLLLLILALLMRFSAPPIVKVKLHLEDPEAEAAAADWADAAAEDQSEDAEYADVLLQEQSFAPPAEAGPADLAKTGSMPPLEVDRPWTAPEDSPVMDGSTAVFHPQNGLEPEAPPIQDYPEDDINEIFPPKEPETPEERSDR